MAYPDVSVVILAAGLSQRMGALNKLLIPVAGVPMIRRTVELYQQMQVGEVIVVVGHESEKVCAALTGTDTQIVHNPDYEQGQVTSIRCGLQRVKKESRTVIVALGDQPRLSHDDIVLLLNRFEAQTAKTMLVPFYQGKRGNPIVLSRSQALDVDKEGVFLGCRKLVDKYPERVLRLDVESPNFRCDLDTPQDVVEVLGENALVEITQS